MLPVIIPSIGRAGMVSSMKWMPPGALVAFAVHDDETQAYRKAYPDASIIPLSDNCRRHTGKVRREIMNTIRMPFIFVDDDISVSLKAAVDMATVFTVLERHLDMGASMAGIGQQLFSNTQMDKTELINGDPWAIRNRFVSTVYAINPPHFDDCPLDRLPVYEDMALIYHAIQRGGGTITSYVATHSNKSPAKGGCNSWRDKEVTLRSLYTLVELYPDICSVRPTNSTTHSQYIGVGLRTAWSKIKKLS